jgi:cobalt-zinc-cadmium efflux system protein
MAYLAILGIVINGIAAWRVGRGQSMNERVISLHMLEDLLGWVAVLVGSIAIKVWNIAWIDPALSIGFTIFILRGVYKTLGSTISLFLQGTPQDIDMHGIDRAIRVVPGVLGVHDCHAWSLDGERHVLTMHAIVTEDAKMAEVEMIKLRIRQVVEHFGNFHTTIEVESNPDDCPDRDCVMRD